MNTLLKNHKTRLAALGLAVTLAGAATSVIADKDDEATVAQIKEASITMEQAIATAQAAVPGKVIESELEMDDDKLIWEVELLAANDRITEFEIDARTGVILEQEQD